MLRTTIIAISTVLLVGVAVPLLSQNATPASPGISASLLEKTTEGRLVRVIIEVRPGLRGVLESAPTSRAQSFAPAMSRVVARLASLRAAYVNHLEGLPLIVAELDRAQLEALLRDPEIISISEDAILAPHLGQSGPLVHAPQVWASGYRGAGFAVAILDTGVQANHPFLAGRVVSEACFSSVSPTLGATSVCAGGATNGPTNAGSGAPCTFSAGCSHGTHVAGIAAGRATSQIAFSGMAPDANIIAIQVFSRFSSAQVCGNDPTPCARAFTSDSIRGLQRVLALSGTMQIAAANMSLGGGAFSAHCDNDPHKALIDQLIAARVATVISSGNDFLSTQVGAPGCISSAITVGSTTKTDTLSSFSNHGALVDMLAPGGSLTPSGGINSSVPGGAIASMSGTSMAAPHVTGAFAVLRSRQATATVAMIEQALESTGVPVAHASTNFSRPRILLDAAGNALQSDWLPRAQTLGDGAGVHTYPALVGDVNGDGRRDLVFVGQGWSGAGLNIRTKLSNGNGTWTPHSQVLGDGSGVHARPALVGDVNGDGRSDLIFVGQGWSGAGLNIRTKLSNGNGTWAPQSQVLGDGNGVLTYPTLVGDVNGDGRDDLIFVGQGWSGAGLNIRTKLSNGNGTWTSHSQVLGDGNGVHARPTLVGDVNGDGRADLIFVGQGWSGAGLNIRVKLSNGNGTWTAQSQVLGDGNGVLTYPTLIGDVNGDGRSDLVFVGQGWSGAGLNVRTKLSNGNGTWTPQSQVLGDGSGVHTYPTLIGDVNGDGRADLVFAGQGWSGAGLNVRTKLSNGNGTWTSRQEVLGDGSGVHQYPALFADISGDGKRDLIFVGQGWSGAGLNIRTKLSNM